MTAPFGRMLVLDLNGAGTGLLQDPNRMRDVDSVAETGVDIDDQRQIDHTADRHYMIGDLAQIHEPEVRQAEVRVGEPGAGQIHGAKAEISNDPGSERVRRAGQNNSLLITKRLDMRCRHHFAPAFLELRDLLQTRSSPTGVSPETRVGKACFFALIDTSFESGQARGTKLKPYSQ
jgi:hypothetical protein